MRVSILDQREILLSQIQIVTNVRRHCDAGKLNDLARSIKKDGILQTPIVRPHPSRPNTFQSVIGERRLRGAKIAGLTAVLCVVCELDDKKVDELQLIENDQREDLSAVERAAGYQVLLEKHGHTPETIAATVQRSRAFVYQTLKILKAPTIAVDALARGEISVRTVAGIARIPNEAAREKAAREIVSDNYTGAQLSERLAAAHIERHYMRELKSAPFDPNDVNLTKAGSCEACPKRTGNNREEFPEGRADVCTDPPCFIEKVAAAEKLTQIEPARGHRVGAQATTPEPAKDVEKMRARLSDSKRKRASELEQRLRFLKEEFAEAEFADILTVAIDSAHRLAQSSRKSDRDLILHKLQTGEGTPLTLEEIMDDLELSRWVAESNLKDLKQRGIVQIQSQDDPKKSGGRPRLIYSLTHSRN